MVKRPCAVFTSGLEAGVKESLHPRGWSGAENAGASLFWSVSVRAELPAGQGEKRAEEALRGVSPGLS
jgi:hypothetical protein